MRNTNEAQKTAVRHVNENKRPSPVHNKPDPVAKTYTATFNRQTQVRNDAKRK
jgi:hypothetical protein